MTLSSDSSTFLPVPTQAPRARPATKRQLEVCRRIAMRTGRTFALPLSFEDASSMIVKAKRSSRARAKRRK